MINQLPKPFASDEENDNLDRLYTNSILKNIDNMILASDKKMKTFLEIFCSSLLLEFNERLPEPNYSIYMTYRIKSSRSNIAKLTDYLNRVKKSENDFSMKDFSDLIGLRIIIEKIPHNISVNADNPNYEEIQKLKNERKFNICLSEEFHDFSEALNSHNCTLFDYYSKSARLINSLLSMLNSEENPSYAKDLKETYNSLLTLCNENLTFLKARGDFSSIISVESSNNSQNNKKSSSINFNQLLEDFDSRIDGKLALMLYSSTLPSILNESETLKSLGATISNDTSRTKPKRESSGFVSDFKGLNFNGIPLNFELQFMSIDEYLASILGYSAHSNMPNKDPNPCEIPSAYANRNIKIFKQIGKTNHLNIEQLRLLRTLIKIKKFKADELSMLTDMLDSLTSDNLVNGLNVTEENRKKLKEFCILNSKQKMAFEDHLHSEGITQFDCWAENICAFHATARLDKDSSAKNRVKIDYDGPYERLAHVMRQQIEGYNLDSSKSDLVEAYLGDVYKNQETWFGTNNNTSVSIMDFEIQNYIRNELPEFRRDIAGSIQYSDKEEGR